MGNSRVCKKCGRDLRKSKGNYCGSCKSEMFENVKKKGKIIIGPLVSLVAVIATRGKRKKL
ncbi:hypothetical protein [Brassicibacter mesophilus]|uniref:hypothetical protein n=1 Tax=Brassicibacter mesophilus TaxID=745119 RepID=UPI003D1A4661